MIKKVLLTGANSMLGVNTALLLLAKGYEVKALLRNSREELTDCDIILGNVTNFEDVKQAAAGCDAIIHIAAATNQEMLHLSDYTKINVVATENVCQASLVTSAKRVIFVSTVNTIGNGTKENPANESYPASTPFAYNLYAQSKLIAEEKALSSGADVLIINPTFMIGAYDSKPSSGQIITMNYGKRIVFAPKGGKNFVAASDVAHAIEAALNSPITREKMLTGGVNLSFADFYTLMAETQGYEISVITLPSSLLYAVGIIGSLCRKIGIKTPISLTNMRILTTREWYTAEKAIKALHMPQTPIEKAITDCINWFKANNKLP
jgi:dihydroflavonol-4-reductase